MDYNPENVQTTEDNASAYIDNVNRLLMQEGITDKEGNPVQLTKLAGSVLWLMALANGQNTTEWQERLRNCYNSLDIANCSDEQVNNLALIAGVVKEEGSAPFVALTVTNTTQSPVLYNRSTVYAEDTFSSHKWYCSQNIEVAGGETTTLIFYCESKDVNTPKSTTFIFHFTDITIPSYSTESTSASVILEPEETVADIRNKIMQGTQAFNQIEQAQNAIKGLNGISKCSLWFNPDPIAPVILNGNIELDARKALIVIRGVDVDNLIAETYIRYLNVATQQLEDSLQSSTVLGAGGFVAYYSVCEEKLFYIKVQVKAKRGDTTYIEHIKDVLMLHIYDLDVGCQLTAQRICAWLEEAKSFVDKIYTAQVSMDNVTYGNVTSFSVLDVGTFDREHIIVENI